MFPKTDDPVIRARQAMIAEWAMAASPETREKFVGEGVRSSLRNVLAVRRLVLSAEDEARIDACTDLDTLYRWLEQAVVAASAADALR